MNSKKGPYTKALTYALCLLKFRMRSEKELSRRLKRKKYDEDAAGKVIAFLKEERYINDGDFARIWAQEKLRKPFGLRRIRRELEIKGIDKEVIDGVFADIKTKYDEDAVVLRLAKERFNRFKRLAPQKAKTRTCSFLLRRGFSPEVVFNTINQLPDINGRTDAR